MDLQDKFLNNHPLFKKIMALIKSGTVTQTTHKELTSLMSKGQLNVGAKYLIPNFQTKHNFFDGSTPIAEVNVGPIEPLIVTALSTDELSNVAFSPQYPNDLIHYDPTDVLCEDGTTPRLGKITKRINTKNNCGAEAYDFRHVKFRRWAIKTDGITPWTDVSFAKGDLANLDLHIAIARKIVPNASGESPDFPSNYWHPLFYFGDENTYLSWKTSDLVIGKEDGDPGVYLTCNLTVQVDDYEDYYTFQMGAVEGSDQVYNTVIGPTLHGEEYNNVVFIAAVGEMPQQNTFGSCGFATIGFTCKNNSFGHEFRENIIGASCMDNIIENNFHNNIVKDQCTSNQIGPYAQKNLIGKLFYDNVIGSYFAGNFTGDSTEDNIFGSGSGAFNTGAGMIENHFGSPCKVTADSGFSNNMLYGNTIVTCEQDSCQKNTIHGGITVDLSDSTHAVAAYNKQIVLIPNGGVRILYVDNAGILTTVLTTV